MSHTLTVTKHPVAGLAIVGVDAYGQAVNVALDRLTALDLSSQLENAALTPRTIMRDTREPRDDSETERDVS
jgi:hypothetical protein